MGVTDAMGCAENKDYFERFLKAEERDTFIIVNV